MAKKFKVELLRTTKERASVLVEVNNKQDAAFKAAQQSPEWIPVSAETKPGAIAAVS